MRINNQKQEISFERNILIKNVNRPGINRVQMVKDFLKERENRPINKMGHLIRKFLKRDKPNKGQEVIVQISNSHDFLNVDKNTPLGEMFIKLKDHFYYTTLNKNNPDLKELYEDAINIVVNDKKQRKLNL